MTTAPAVTRDSGENGPTSGKSLVSSIVNWLRAGYPDEVPGPDRVPLLALLATTPLTDGSVGWRAAHASRSDPVSITNRYRTSLATTRS